MSKVDAEIIKVVELIGAKFDNEEMFYDFMQDILPLLKGMNKISTRLIKFQWENELQNELAVKF